MRTLVTASRTACSPAFSSVRILLSAVVSFQSIISCRAGRSPASALAYYKGTLVSWLSFNQRKWLGPPVASPRVPPGTSFPPAGRSDRYQPWRSEHVLLQCHGCCQMLHFHMEWEKKNRIDKFLVTKAHSEKSKWRQKKLIMKTPSMPTVK